MGILKYLNKKIVKRAETEIIVGRAIGKSGTFNDIHGKNKIKLPKVTKPQLEIWMSYYPSIFKKVRK